MTEPLTIPFKPEHLKELTLQPHEAEMIEFERFLGVVMAETSEVRSCFYANKLLGIGGYHTLWPGVVEVFITPSIHIFEYPLVAFRTAKMGMEMIMADPSVHRIQTSTLDDQRRTKFIQKLGLSYEGTMRSYTRSKDDYKMWAWVRGE